MLFRSALGEFFLQNRSIKQTILKNSIWLTSANIIARCFKFFLVPFAARILAPEQFGLFNYTLSLLVLYFLFSDLGINGLFVREYNQDSYSKKTLISSASVLKVFLFIASVGAGMIAFLFLKDPVVKQLFFVFLIKVLLDNINKFLSAILQADNHMQYESIKILVETIFTTCLGIVVLLKTRSLFYFSIVYMLGSVLGFLILS